MQKIPGAEAKDNPLSLSEQGDLLTLARRTLRHHILNKGSREDIIKGLCLTENLKKISGVFVTLKIKGELRGCIGYIEPRKPLYQAVIDNTMNSSTGDPRFLPVSPSEVDKIDIDISVLTIPQEVPGPSCFQVGRHGIILSKGASSAVFLPQVAPEQGWDREATLIHLSRKAGLNQNAWNDKDAKFKIFTAQVFHE